MGIFVLGSAAGSPGVTSTAIGLALSWPRTVILIEADCHNAIVTGLFLGQQNPRGLLNVLETFNMSSDYQPAEVLWGLSTPLTQKTDTTIERRFLPGVPTPPALRGLESAMGPLTDGMQALGAAGVDVIVDLGRYGSVNADPVLSVASAALLVVRPTLRDVAAARWAAANLGQTVGTSRAHLITIDIRPGMRGFTDGEVSETLSGLKVITKLPYDPATAGVWSDGAVVPSRLHQARHRYRAAVAGLAGTLHRRVVATAASTFIEGGS